MSRFWLIIGAIFVVVIVVLWATASQSYEYPPAYVQESVKYLVAMTLVGVVWAVFHRRQLEQFRVSLLSLFFLVTMEAVLLAAARLIEVNYYR